MNDKKHDLISVEQVAEMLMVAKTTVQRWTQKGWMKNQSVGGDEPAYLRSEVERFALERNMVLQASEGDKLRILIVEDEVPLAAYLSAILEDLSDRLETEVAHDGFDAGTKLQVFKPDIVLLDLMLPGMDGLQVCRKLKEDPNTRDTRVIGMTGRYNEDVRQKLLDAGAEACIKKPVDKKELLTLISTQPEFSGERRSN